MNIELFCNGKKLKNATLADVEVALQELQIEAGFSLSIIPRPTEGPKELYVESEDGNYRPVMSSVGQSLIEFVNLDGKGKEMVGIRGYSYDPVSVTQDFELIKSMVKVFYETGDVPADMWRRP